jgi:serine/threonine-protein kinase
MTYKKNVLLIFILAIGAIVTGFAIHNHIAGVRAARLEQAVSTAPLFPPGAIWTQDISHEPVDPQSATIINWLANAGGWGHNNRLQDDWSIRIMQADAHTPRVPFRKGREFYTLSSDEVSTVPLPPGGGMEGSNSYHCNNHVYDCHFIVVDRGEGKLYEAWGANYDEEQGVLEAHSIAVWDLNRVYPPSGRGDNCTSADAAGFPIAALFFNADDLAAGRINHALSFLLPNERIRAGVFVHPATHGGSPAGPASAPPFGVHFRLKASYDVSQLPPAAQVVARAMQKYGMFLSDGGDLDITSQNDKDTKTKYADVNFGSHDLYPLKVTDFEVVDLGKPIRLTHDCVRNP